MLFERQQQRFQNTQLDVLNNLRTRLLNRPCFGDVTEADKLISNLHTELENDCRTYGCVDKGLYESLTSSNVSEAVAVIYDPPSGPEMSISETCPVVGSNPVVPETPCTNTDLSSSQADNVLLNAHEIIAVAAREETENESSGIMKTIVSNGAHHSRLKFYDESTYWSSLKNLSDASNDNQEPNKILIDADYSSDRLPTNEIFKKFDDNVSEESNYDDLISSVFGPHHLATFSEFSVQCDKYVLNIVKLIVTWEYEDPTLFRGGGYARKI
ncbi:unnamed protein product [Schistosoma margrebowiei]|uniref:Uncharacterized protein n=1 Tax=Schistosoma margrebowiei TaxID=48269 RepID=A0A3P8EFC4_9TREM|nr:unnamed protein product [Schistosoma margrebowiei]